MMKYSQSNQRVNIAIWGNGSFNKISKYYLSNCFPKAEYYDLLTEPQTIQSIYDTVSQNRIDFFFTAIGNSFGYSRYKISQKLITMGLKPISIITPSAFVDKSCALGRGIAIFNHATVGPFCSIGENCIVNTGATIDHECAIKNGVHIMGAAALAGRVTVNDYATIGTNATILPDINIGEGAYIGAGAVVIKDVSPYTVVAGNPAKPMKKCLSEIDVISKLFLSS